MRVIARRTLREFYEDHAASKAPLEAWFHEVAQFLFYDHRSKPDKSLQEYWGDNSITQGEILRTIKIMNRLDSK